MVCNYYENLPEEIRENISNRVWREVNIIVNYDKEYRVLINDGGTPHRVLIKPTNTKRWCGSCKAECYGYHQAEYETLFGFGCHCGSFSLDKVVDLGDNLRNTYHIDQPLKTS